MVTKTNMTEEEKIKLNKLKLLKKTNEMIFILRGKKSWFSDLEINNPRFVDLMASGVKMAFDKTIEAMNEEFDKPFKRRI